MRRFLTMCTVTAGTLFAQDADEMLEVFHTGPVETAYELGVASATAKLYAYMQTSGLIAEEDAVETASIMANRLKKACAQTSTLKGLAAATRTGLITGVPIGTGSPEGDRVALSAFEAGVTRLEELGRELCSLAIEAHTDAQH